MSPYSALRRMSKPQWSSGSRLWTNRRTEHGPFDIIGDVHGCVAELVGLLRELGWDVSDDDLKAQLSGEPPRSVSSATSSTAGLTFRPCYGSCCRWSSQALRCAFRATMTSSSSAPSAAATSNWPMDLPSLLHSSKASRRSSKRRPQRSSTSSSATSCSTMAIWSLRTPECASASKAAPHGASATSLSFGETTGETDEFGLPVRYDWAQEYRGHAMVVYGHTPVPEAVWVNGTINIDTGCVFGGRLTALRYPERELVSVPARETYYEPLKPLAAAEPEQVPQRDGASISSTSRMFSASELSRRASMGR